MLGIQFHLDDAASQVLTYDFNGGSYDEESCWRMYDYFLRENIGDKNAHLIVLGEPLTDYSVAGYEDGGCEEEIPGFSARVVTETTNLGEVFRRCAADHWQRYQQAIGPLPGYATADSLYRIAADLYLRYGSGEALVARYGWGRLDDLFMDVAAMQRVLYAAVEVTIPAGETLTLSAAFEKQSSFNFMGPKEQESIYGYDFCTALGSGFAFTEQTLHILLPDTLELTARDEDAILSAESATLPLLLGDTYSGIVESWPLFGALGALLLLVIFAVVCYFLNASLLGKGAYVLEDKELTVYRHNHRLKKRCALALVGALLITVIAHVSITSLWGPWSIMKGQTFNDYDSFVAYMEQDVSYFPYGAFGNATMEAPVPDSDTYYDQYGNEISEEDARREVLTDKAGTEIEFLWRNEAVCSIRYGSQDDTLLPIIVSTYDDLHEAQAMVAVRHLLFGTIYCLEILIVFLLYFRKRLK